VLKDNDVTLGVTSAIDLNMTNSVVKLRKGNNFLQFENDVAELSATSVNINGNVNINGANFSVTPASVKIGDMVCLLVPDAQALGQQAQAFADILAQTAKVQADIASEQAAQKLGEVAERLTRSLDEAKRESAELKGKLEEMERMINQAVYIA
jgi:polyhydroxyalkanoate synthesis regulator phasin